MRGLWVTLGVGVLVGGLVWWSLEDEKKRGDQPERKADAPRILDLPVDAVKRVELKRPAENLDIVLEKDGLAWRITAPQAYRADGETAGALASALAALDSTKLVDEKATDFAPYGFNAPRLVASVSGKTIEVGDENPANGEYYVRVAGQPKLYTIASASYTALDKRVADLRDKKLVAFEPADVKTIELTAKGATLAFERNKQRDWQITKPGAYRADGFSVEEVARKLAEARMDFNAPDETAKFTAGTPVATARVTGGAGLETIDLRKSGEDYFAKSSVVPGVHKLNKDVAEALDKDLNAFRAKKIFEPSTAESRVEFRDGATARVFDLTNGTWSAGGKKVENVPALVDKLRELSVLRYVEGGMAAPVIEAKLVSPFRQQLVKISKSGNMWIAQREGHGELYEIDGKAIEELQKSASAIK